MIRSALSFGALALALALPRLAWADAQALDGGVAPDDTILERYRTPWEALNERKIGEASRAVRFDWRKSELGFGVEVSELLELNNFGSARFGGFLRRPLGSFLLELGVTWVFGSSSDSAQKLALTPYRQFGRPSRLEIDLNVGFPLAEGVATARLGFFPATELVFSVNAGLRYLFYPGALGGISAGDVLKDMFGLKLSQVEYDNLEKTRPAAMQIDGARYSVLVGFSVDVYLQPGLFLSPRVMLGLPVLAGISGPMGPGGLGFWWELTVALGWAL